MTLLRRPLTRAESRQVDQLAIESFGMSGLVLMENAGREAARVIAARYPPADICILCGKGNNGGDGYVIARHLQLAHAAASEGQATVQIVSVVDPAELAGDAAVNAQIARLAEIPMAVVTDSQQLSAAVGTPSLIVDCLLGTGAQGNPRGVYAEAICLANALPARRIAIDLPSGLDADSGAVGEPTFCAELTLTMVAAKVGFATATAKAVLGEVVVIPIGVPLRLLERFR